MIGAALCRCGPRQRSVKSPCAVERDRPFGGVDELDLVRLALRLEDPAGLVAVDLAALERPALGDLAPDLLLEPRAASSSAIGSGNSKS